MLGESASTRMQYFVLTFVVVSGFGCSEPVAVRSSPRDAAIESAVHYLEAEIPRWRAENRCFSCHNNGDAVRALSVAAGRGYSVSKTSLDDTLNWLQAPGSWDDNPGDPEFKDRRLARLQFAAALAAAERYGFVEGGEALRHAAKLVAAEQREDGSWAAANGGTLGNPITYGDELATSMAVDVLASASSAYQSNVESAWRWLRERPIVSTLDAAVALATSSRERSPEARQRQTAAIELLARAQTSRGGWGPHPETPAEVFDTALALLALARLNDARTDRELVSSIAAGRRYLLNLQLEDGGWPETTRPAGSDSYAQHISTTAWALLALLAAE